MCETGFEGLDKAMEACKGMEIGADDMARLAAEVEALAAVPLDSLMGEFPNAIEN